MITVSRDGRIGIVEIERIPTREEEYIDFLYSFTEKINILKEESDISVIVILAAEGSLNQGEFAFPPLDGLYPSLTAPLMSCSAVIITSAAGVVSGLGFELFLTGDIRVASTNSLFSMPQVRFGVLPQEGGTQLLPRLVGRTKASFLLLTGDPLEGEEALRVGIIHRLFGRESIREETLRLAHHLGLQAPYALKFAKEAVTRGLELPLTEGLRLEADLYFLLCTTEDRKEGIMAFREKRKPNFQGR